MIASMATKPTSPQNKKAQKKLLEPPSRPPKGPLRLTERMAAKGISDAEMARRLGVDRSTVGKWQNEQTRLDPFIQARLAKELECWPSQLWFLPGSTEDRLLEAIFRNVLPQYPPVKITPAEELPHESPRKSPKK